jgi:hypothetical protein
VLRPEAEVETTGLDELGEQVSRFDPQVVVCSRDKPASLPAEVAWPKVPIDSVPQSKLTLEALLTVIDGIQETRSPGGLELSPGSNDGVIVGPNPAGALRACLSATGVRNRWGWPCARWKETDPFFQSCKHDPVTPPRQAS